MRPKTSPTCVRLSSNQRAALEAISSLTGKSISDLIRDAVIREIAAFGASKAAYDAAIRADAAMAVLRTYEGENI